MKLEARALVLPLGLLGVNLGISLYFMLSGRLPNPTPAGFFFDGTVLSYASPWVVATRIPMIMGVLIAGILVGVKWDPLLKTDSRKRQGAFGAITTLILTWGCFVNLQYLTFASSTGPVRMQPVIVILFGFLFMGIGNFIAKSGSNGFWVMRNRWTNKSEQIERQANRLLGLLFVAGGLGVAVASPWIVEVPSPFLDWFFVAFILMAITVAVIASYRMAGHLAVVPEERP